MEANKLFSRKYFVVLSCLLLLGCDPKSKSNDTEWVNEELLNQLTELRKDVLSLKSDIADLKKTVESKKLNVAQKPRKVIPPPKEVKFGGRPILGNKNAEIAIIEFSDYECPYCSRHYKQVFPSIKKKLIDKGHVKYMVYDHPLSFHPNAMSAAIAANCAHKFGKYWDMHDKIFSNRKKLGKNFYLDSISAMGIDKNNYEGCLAESKQLSMVEAEIKYGNSISVSGTPKFFVGKVDGNKITNVIVVNGAQPYQKFESAIKKLGVKI